MKHVVLESLKKVYLDVSHQENPRVEYPVLSVHPLSSLLLPGLRSLESDGERRAV